MHINPKPRKERGHWNNLNNKNNINQIDLKILNFILINK